MRVLSIPILVIATAIGGCAEDQRANRMPPQNLVPSTAIVQAGYRNDRPMPSQALPASDAAYDFPRWDRFVYAPDYGGYSYTYTYDYQEIGIRNSGGYGSRYRYIYQPLP